jgi:hypothetical protein
MYKSDDDFYVDIHEKYFNPDVATVDAQGLKKKWRRRERGRFKSAISKRLIGAISLLKD